MTSSIQQRLAPALSLVQRRWGSSAVRTAADLSTAGDTIATGFDALDGLLTGGGIPRGRLTEISCRGGGAHGLAFAILARAQAEQRLVAYLDLSETLDPASALAHGVQLEHLLVVRPADIPEALAMLRALAACGDVEAIAVDSLNPLAMAGSRALDAALTSMVAALARTRSTVIAISDQQQPGAEFLGAHSALAHVSRLRLHVARAGWVEEHGVFGQRPRVTGARTEVTVLAQPGQAAPRTATLHIRLPL